MTRKETLEEAIRCVCSDRESQYGTPEDNFRIIADLWSAYKGIVFSPVDVAMMMSLLKIARVKSGTGTADSFVDLAGYAACGAELRSIEPLKGTITVSGENENENYTFYENG